MKSIIIEATPYPNINQKLKLFICIIFNLAKDNPGIVSLPTSLTRHSSGRGLCFGVFSSSPIAAPLNAALGMGMRPTVHPLPRSMNMSGRAMADRLLARTS